MSRSGLASYWRRIVARVVGFGFVEGAPKTSCPPTSIGATKNLAHLLIRLQHFQFGHGTCGRLAGTQPGAIHRCHVSQRHPLHRSVSADNPSPSVDVTAGMGPTRQTTMSTCPASHVLAILVRIPVHTIPKQELQMRSRTLGMVVVILLTLPVLAAAGQEASPVASPEAMDSSIDDHGPVAVVGQVDLQADSPSRMNSPNLLSS